jgi:hypothetical protein
MNAKAPEKNPSPLRLEEPVLGAALGFFVGALLAVAYPIVWVRIHGSDWAVYDVLRLCTISLAEWVPRFVIFGLSGGILLALLDRFLPRIHRFSLGLLFPGWVLGAFVCVACIYHPEQFRYIYALKCVPIALAAAVPSYCLLAWLCGGSLRGRKALLALVVATAVLVWVPLGILKVVDFLPPSIGERLS